MDPVMRTLVAVFAKRKGCVVETLLYVMRIARCAGSANNARLRLHPSQVLTLVWRDPGGIF